jgi:hypothetical protein
MHIEARHYSSGCQPSARECVIDAPSSRGLVSRFGNFELADTGGVVFSVDRLEHGSYVLPV